MNKVCTLNENDEFFIPVQIVSDESIIKETLGRIGIPNKIDKILYQTCHLVKIKDVNTVIHFKEYFAMNNGNNNDMIQMDEDDFKRRNTIIYLLKHWNLINFTTEHFNTYINANKTTQRMFVLNYHDKHNWELRTKVNVDNKEQE